MHTVSSENLGLSTVPFTQFDGDPTQVLPPVEQTAEPTVVLPVSEAAAAPVEDSFVPQFVPGAPLTVGREAFDNLGAEPVSMKTLGKLGRRGQSNAEEDPSHTALIKAVADLGIGELEVLASGDTSVISADLLGAVTSEAIADARKYAGNLAKLKREQAQERPASSRASVLASGKLAGFTRRSQPQPVEPSSSSRITSLISGAAAGRKAAAEAMTGGLDAQVEPIIFEPLKAPKTKGGVEPLPVRQPGKALIAEELSLTGQQRAELFEAQQIALQALNEQSEQATPQAPDEEARRKEQLTMLRRRHAVFRLGAHDLNLTGRSKKSDVDVQNTPPEAPASTKPDDDNDRIGGHVADEDITEIIPRLHRDDVQTVRLPKIVVPEQPQPAMASEVVPPQAVSAAGVAIAGIAKTVRPEIRRHLDSVFAAVSAALKIGGSNRKYTGRHRPAFA